MGLFDSFKKKEKNSSYKTLILGYIIANVPKDIHVYFREEGDDLLLNFEYGPAIAGFSLELDESRQELSKEDFENIKHGLIIPALRNIREQLQESVKEINFTLNKI
jgi:hypothetical protein